MRVEGFDELPDGYEGAPEPTIDGVPLEEFITRYGRAEASRRLNLAFPGLKLGPYYDPQAVADRRWRREK